MIPQQVIDTILSAVNIEDYIGKEIELKRAGVNKTACCPFHNEKTPSFVISPIKGIFKCYGCGEGGNVISWVMKRHQMTFPEAVRKLAREHNIPYEEKEQTPEEIESGYKRESIIIANAAVNTFYVEQLARNKEAKEYCLSRWSENVIKEMEIGYAPDEWTAAKDYLLSKQFTIEVLDAAGIVALSEKTQQHYDFFRGRITIPIRDKNGNITGFTARVFRKKDENSPKFINTKDTLAFKKNEQLFGIHHARRAASQSDKIILAEGAPDIIKLQSIGVHNSVASLGTDFSQHQINIIKTCAKNIVMIPDTDTPGQKAAIKNGVLFFRNGFNVSVILLKDAKDVDEAFQSKQDYLDALESDQHIDFLVWHAANMLANASQSESSKADAIGDICKILAECPDENKVDMYIETLSKLHKPKKVWQSKLSEARGLLQNATQAKKYKDNNTTVERFGFSVEKNSYYGLTAKGQSWKWSNFIMTPLAHVRGSNSKRLYIIKNEYNHEQTIEVKQEDLVSLSKFRIKTESMGNFLWEAGEIELHRLKRYLYENTITCDEITQLGWQKKHDFYAWGNGGVVDGVFVKVNEIGILKIRDNNYYLPAFSKIFENDPHLFQFERKFTHSQSNGISLYDYSEKLISVFGDNAKVALCFLFATLFNDIIKRHSQGFPILNLFGPKGTGKSELGHSLTSFFISKNIPPNINNTTIPALAESVAQVSNAIVHIDEYKNTIDLDRREFLKGLWDSAGRTRMNMERDKKRETTNVDSGIVLSGQEMPTADIALFSRLIFLTFNKTDFSDIERRAFEELKRIEARGLSHLTNEILRFRKQFEERYRDEQATVSKLLEERLKNHEIEDRTFKNWVTVISAIRPLATHLHLPFTQDEMLDIACQGIIKQNAKTKENNELSGFWTTLNSLVRSVQIIESVDYKIKGLPAATALTGYASKVNLDPNKRYLLLNFNNVVPAYMKEGRSTGDKVLPKDSLLYYLQNSPEYIGIKKSERFQRLAYANSTVIKSNPSTIQDNGGKAFIVTTCMVFDYESLMDKYDLSIDEHYGNNIDDEDVADVVDIKEIKPNQTKIDFIPR